jgi:hypothetical protein
MGLGTNAHLSAVVKGYLKVSGEVTANNSFRAKHTDDCCIYPRVSKLCNFYPAKVGRSKDTQQNLRSPRRNNRRSKQVAQSFLSLGSKSFRFKFFRCCYSLLDRRG